MTNVPESYYPAITHGCCAIAPLYFLEFAAIKTKSEERGLTTNQGSWNPRRRVSFM
jgi:hypothetical protein